jgi:hypothetical protein
MTTRDGHSRGHNARCVIWRAPDAAVPPGLRSALHQRGLWFTECDNASWAIAELCRIEDQDTPVILLILSPKNLEGVKELLAISERYAPHAAHWVYDEESDPKLQTVVRVGARRRGPALADPQADNPDSGCKSGQDSPSILNSDELASLKHPDQAGESPS